MYLDILVMSKYITLHKIEAHSFFKDNQALSLSSVLSG